MKFFFPSRRSITETIYSLNIQVYSRFKVYYNATTQICANNFHGDKYSVKMVKQHAIKLTILNNTVFPMIYHGMWFDSGRVADGFSWPKTIFTKENHTIMCNERDWAVSGCSGYVQYVMSGYIITIAFSNPSVGSNKVGVDLNPNGKAVWEKIGSNDYQDFSINFKLLTVPITVNCSCTGGIVNFANVEFNQLHFN